MKISPVTQFYSYNNRNKIKAIQKNNQSNGYNKKPLDLKAYPYTYFLGTKKYKYNPIPSTQPNYNYLDCDYRNIDIFARNFSAKINSQLKSITLNDVKDLCKRIQKETNADEKTVNEVLFGLTQFSNYDTMKHIQKLSTKYNTNNFGIQPSWKYWSKDISVNSVFNYFSANKNFIQNTRRYPGPESIVILDDMFIQQLKKSKSENNGFYEQFVNDVNNGAITILNLKGWNIKCQDGSYKSAGFLYGSGYLEDMALNVIKRIQNGELLDEILYSDIENDLKSITEDDIDFDKKEIVRYFANSKDFIFQEDIYQNLKTPRLTTKKIKNAIDIFLKENSQTGYSNEDEIKVIAKYLDEMASCYSFETIASELKQMEKLIKEKFGEDVLYTVIEQNKSTSLISHIYAKINNIPIEKFYRYDDNRMHEDSKDKGCKITVVIDDISASGSTLKKYENKAWMMNVLYDAPLNFALLTAGKSAIDLYKSQEHMTGDMIYCRTLKDIKQGEFDLLNKDEIKLIKKLMHQGFKDLALCIAFPHIIPDNCASIAGVIFNDLLISNTQKSNKALMNSDITASIVKV